MLRIVSQIKSNLQYVPLKDVNIEATIGSFAADVTVTQNFRNDTKVPIEAIYYFPIEEQAAIYKFTARIDDREIVAQLKVKREFHHGHYEKHPNGYLLEQDENCQDNFIINIGTLAPSKDCTILISYVTELDLIQGSIIRFVIPATIVSRYNPQKNGLQTKSKFVQSNPYGIHFRCRVEKLKGPKQELYIARLTSPSHQIDIDLSNPDMYLITFDQANMYLDRDILIDVKLTHTRENTFVVVESGAVMAAVTPFEEDCYVNLDNTQTNEFIFIVDCSSSMRNENKIGLVREAMLFFLENLPQNCYFNIIKFGARYTCLFNESVAFYNNIHIRIATKFISQIRADLGGTEMLAPLQWLERHPPRPNRFRQVFLVTDGQVSNVSEILELCRSMASSTRIFSFGLGATPSRSLVKGLARTTNGRAVFIPPNTGIEEYVSEQLQKAIRRCITNVRVQWNLGIDVESIPNQLPQAYLNDRLIIYALANNQSIPLTSKSSIEIRTDQSYYRLDIADSDRIRTTNQMIERLAAKALILQLEHNKYSSTNSKTVRFQHIDDEKNFAENQVLGTKQQRKQRIIDLSLKYNILSPYTVFIGIEKYLTRTTSHEIPIEISVQSLIHTVDRSIEDSMPPFRYTTSTCFDSSLLHDSHADQHESIASINSVSAIDHLIQNQTADGLWYFPSNSELIEDLTGKPLAAFKTSDPYLDQSIVVAAIIVVQLESKFAALRSVWENMVEKARRRLIDLLHNDWKEIVILFRDIRMSLNQ
ncbi:unnamed protein product [Adineta ricciae]|uniref:Uncharacterized protein n=1 Tax=Adineta ricciae TaxID=249248 RepID=A0A814GEB8_ADIRI|nr:unnamed protein product [Adineta ricciae]CAF1276962.1 unnamed protein product [Adineta ricciae]